MPISPLSFCGAARTLYRWQIDDSQMKVTVKEVSGYTGSH